MTAVNVSTMNDDQFDDLDSSVEVQRSRKRMRTTSLSSDSNEDDHHDSFVNGDFVWKQQNRTPKMHNFTAVSGATINTEGMSRREIFELFFNDELVEKILHETNKYGARNANFVQVTEAELKVYIALNIVMSLVQKPTVQSYWSKDKSIETPYFNNVMPRNRFLSIASNLHFTSNNDNSDDPLIKIREVADMTAKNFRRMYKPHKNISIDESLMQCRSRLHYIQFIRTKRARFGIKFYKLCDSETRYIHNFKIYVGKEKTDSGSANRNVVINLMKESNLLHQGYCLFIDNWYSSPNLYRELYNMQTNVCGTAKVNRKGMPRELKSVRLEKGEAVVFSTEDMAAIKWKDKKDVVVTTIHSLDFAETGKVNRYSGEKILKPSVIIDYNKNINRIDIGDQTLSKFHTMQRCKKAYKKIFFYFVDMMLLNSYILFKNNKKDRAFHIYKQKLADAIISKYLKNKRIRETSPVNDVITRYTGRHFPTRIPPTAARGRKTSKRCIVCLSKSIRRETVFKCDICDVPLCIDHFKDYHINKV